jgi:hypothetical protein
LLPALVVLVALLAACSAPAAPVLTDPNEILTQGLQATADLKSFHMELTLDGTVTDPTSGQTFPLSNTSIEGDFDLEHKALAASFGVMGFAGDVRVVDDAAYVKMSLTGPQWIKTEVTPTASGDPMGAVTDPASAIAELRTFLERDGVETRLLDDGSCAERACYHVQVSLSADVLDEAATEAGETATLPSSMFPDGIDLDVFFDKEKLYLSRLALDLSGSEVGDVSAVLNLSKVDEAVSVEAPPADEVTEGGGGLPFP